MTKAEARTGIRTLMRDSTTDFHSNDLIDTMVDLVLWDELANDLASADSSFYRTRKVLTGMRDALDAGVYELYPLPDDLLTLMWIDRDDLPGRPTIWEPRAAAQDTLRFRGVLQGTLDLSGDGGSSYSLPRTFGWGSATLVGSNFKMVPAPTSTTEKFGVEYVRRPRKPRGENEVIDVPPTFEHVVQLAAAIKVLMFDGDPHAENLKILLYGDPRRPEDKGAFARAKKTAADRATSDMRLAPARF